MALYGTGSNPVVQLDVGGTWTDISTYVRGEQKVVISRGRANEQSRAAGQTANFTLDNADGRFSLRNPTGPYYGSINLNSQCRVLAGADEQHVKMLWRPDNGNPGTVSTTDKAVLDITGDIDIRAELWPRHWANVNKYMIIASKWSGTTQLSWVLYMTIEGYLKFRWTTGGSSATQVDATSTATVDLTGGRQAIRVTLDVNNGAAGKTVTFYTSDSIGGSWTTLGSAVTTAGTTSIFSSTANLVLGGGDTSHAIFSDGMGYGGKLYGFELRNGIGGTLVADADMTTQTIGATSWSDGLGTPNTWTVNGSARVTSDRCRFWGELTLPSSKWDKSGADVTVAARSSGVIRRLSQGASALRSPMYRNFSQYDPHGYWPFEDGSDATAIASAVQGGTPATYTACNLGVSTDLPGTGSAVQFTGSTSRISGQANSTTATNTISWVFYVKLSALPGSAKTFARFTANGLVRKVEVAVSNTVWQTTFYAADGSLLATDSTAIGTVSPNGAWVGYNLKLDVSGGNVRYSIRWDNVDALGGGVGPTSLGAGSPGRAFSFTLFSSSDSVFNDALFAHMLMDTQDLDIAADENFRAASNAYLGETSVARQERLAAEEGVTIEVTGDADESEAMGYQSVDTFMNLIYECWDADRGVGGECRDLLALQYVTRGALEHREDLVLDYTASELSEVPTPADDDQGKTNDMTVTRRNGGSGRYELTSGSMFLTTADPPTGVGRYDGSATLAIQTETRAKPVASWMAHVGSYDQERFPQVQIGLHRSAVVAAQADKIIAVDLGDSTWLTNLPAWMPPDDVWLLTQGYAETLSKHLWDISFNTTPGGAYNTGRYDYQTELGTSRYDHGTSTLNGAHNSSTISLSVALNSSTPTTVDKWTTNAAHFPFDIIVAGERMTVTNITGSTSPQTFTVTRSVNGVVKSLPDGARVRLFRPIFWRL